MFLVKNFKNLNFLFGCILLILTTYLVFLNFINESGYWYDEFCTLLTSDPNVSSKVIYERHKGNFEKPNENVPILYYLVLRFFFDVFGFTSQNGRIFSLIFYLISSISVYFLAKKNLNESQSFFVAISFLSTPLIVWMANETRVDMFLIFFSLVNLLVFFNVLKKKDLGSSSLLFLSNILTLSIYPLTISLIISQGLFVILKKNLNLFLIIVFSIIVYFFLNFDYLIDKTLNKGHHFAILHLNFFIGFFFNVFFGSTFFGALYLISFVFFLIKNFAKIYKNDFLTFIIISIFITYLMVVSSSLFVTPIAAPRYIIFIIPLILIFIFTNIFLFEKKEYFFLIFFIISTSCIFFNYDERPIKKPKIDEAIKIVEELDEKKIYLIPQSSVFTTYISTVKNIKQFEIVKNTDILNLRLNHFILVCLNNPKYEFETKPKKDNERCLINFDGYKEIVKINFDDFLIRKFVKNE